MKTREDGLLQAESLQDISNGFPYWIIPLKSGGYCYRLLGGLMQDPNCTPEPGKINPVVVTKDTWILVPDQIHEESMSKAVKAHIEGMAKYGPTKEWDVGYQEVMASAKAPSAVVVKYENLTF